jgi:hypothetical protein
VIIHTITSQSEQIPLLGTTFLNAMDLEKRLVANATALSPRQHYTAQ